MSRATPSGTTVTERQAARATAPAQEADVQELFVGDREYAQAFGEDLARTLDVDTWATGIDWEGAVARLRSEIEAAVHREECLRETVRREVLPKIGKATGAPEEAGVYLALPDELAKVHEGLLFPGQVEAVDGTSVSHDTLPLGITQIGIAVVSYGGTSATFAQRVYRKEIAGRSSDPFKAALEVIDRRDARSGVDQKDGLSELARRGIMTYAERRILLDTATTARDRRTRRCSSCGSVDPASCTASTARPSTRRRTCSTRTASTSTSPHGSPSRTAFSGQPAASRC